MLVAHAAAFRDAHLQVEEWVDAAGAGVSAEGSSGRSWIVAASASNSSRARTDEEAVRSPLEPSGVAKLRKVSPDVQQRLLRRIVGKVGVAKNPVSGRVQPVPDGDGEARGGPSSPRCACTIRSLVSTPLPP